MGLMKNMAIKSVTKKIVVDLWNEIYKKYTISPNQELSKNFLEKEMMKLYVDMTGEPLSIPKDIKAMNQGFDFLLFSIVFFRLRYELSYDITFGTDDDFILIQKEIDKTLVKIRSSFV